MNVRRLMAEDLPILRDMYDRTGFHQKPFPDMDDVEEVRVVEDESGPMIAAYARLVPEVTLISVPNGITHPLVKFQGIALLHNELREALSGKGFREAIASTPPFLKCNWARHLQRHFGWQESWPTYRIEYGKEGS